MHGEKKRKKEDRERKGSVCVRVCVSLCACVCVVRFILAFSILESVYERQQKIGQFGPLGSSWAG